MNQIFRDLKSGETRVGDILSSHNSHNQALMNSVKALLSVGTDCMLFDFCKGNRVEKALEQPNIFKWGLESIGADGIEAKERRYLQIVSQEGQSTQSEIV